MSIAPWTNNQIIRYVINSKDRIGRLGGIVPSDLNASTGFGTPINFEVQFKNPVVAEGLGEMWVKLSNFSLSSTPFGINKSKQGDYSFDTNNHIDLCVDFGGFPLTLDTEQGQSEKTSGDRTLAIIPVSRTYPIAELNIDSPWIKIRNGGNLSTLGFKLFSDLGLYLSAKLTETFTDLPDQVTNAGYTTSGSYTQQITLSFASAPLGVSRGNEIYNSGTLPSTTQLTNFISGPITVLSVSGTIVVLGFTSQIVQSFSTSKNVSFRTGARQQPIDEWSLELQVATTNPDAKSRPV